MFEEEKLFASKTFEHSRNELSNYKNIIDQYDYRLNIIKDWLIKEKFNFKDILAVVGRGGLLRPIPGGTYIVSPAMVSDLEKAIGGEHASNLGPLLAKGLADVIQVNAFTVDPVAIDEFHDLSRISGLKEINRRSQSHALNIRAMAHKYAKQSHKDLRSINLVIAHLGGGISVASVEEGHIIDVNNANEMGPFSPERTGSLPVGDLINMCYSGEYSKTELRSMVQGSGGLFSYLGTTNGVEIESRIKQGDRYAKLIYDAMAYQIGKEIGSAAVVLKGNVDQIILAGGLAYSNYLTNSIVDMIGFIAPISNYPGEDEMGALNKGVLRVLNNLEPYKIYEKEVNI